MENSKKSLKEDVNTSYTKEDFERILQIDRELKDGLELSAEPKSYDVPFAWDNTIEGFEDNKVVIVGNLTPGGGAGIGTVTIKVPFDTFKQYYDIVIPGDILKDAELDEEDEELIRVNTRFY
jgi:hypothetical protein